MNKNNQWQPTITEINDALALGAARLLSIFSSPDNDIRFDHFRGGFFRVVRNDQDDVLHFICSDVTNFIGDAVTTISRQKVSVDYVANCVQVTPQNVWQFVGLKISIVESIQHVDAVPVEKEYAQMWNEMSKNVPMWMIPRWKEREVPQEIAHMIQSHPYEKETNSGFLDFPENDDFDDFSGF